MSTRHTKPWKGICSSIKSLKRCKRGGVDLMKSTNPDGRGRGERRSDGPNDMRRLSEMRSSKAPQPPGKRQNTAADSDGSTYKAAKKNTV